MELRGHHLLCVQGFQGYGYNEEFVTNMREVVNNLNNSDDIWIETTDKCDVICTACPYNVDSECSKDYVKSMDLQVLDELAFAVGDKVKMKEVISKVKENPQRFYKFCTNCEWQYACLFIKSITVGG